MPASSPCTAANAPFARALLITCMLALGACGQGEGAAQASEAAAASAAKPADEAGEAITPPFAVRGELEGLLLVWTDAEGQHSAKTRSEIPEAQREHVRIDSLDVPPERRLDPESIYVADLRAAKADGSYAVHKHSRAWLQARAEQLAPAPEPEAAASGGITLYKTSWCGVCRAAAAYLRSREIAFVEKDIEKDPAAAAEMQRKAAAAGKSPRGVPVIDFHGTILLGYDQQQLASLIDRQPRTL